MKFEFSAGGIVYKRKDTTFHASLRGGDPSPSLRAKRSNLFGGSGQAPQSQTRLPRSFSVARNDIQILLAQHSQHHGWVFPKGLIDDLPFDSAQGKKGKETKEAAALREVEEETGAIGEIKEALTPITYWYQWEDEKRKKTVYYFIMEYAGGDITKHDHEMENVEWLPMEEVEKRLTYDSDKEVWKEAKEILLSSSSW